jgi:hypothetical protein
MTTLDLPQESPQVNPQDPSGESGGPKETAGQGEGRQQAERAGPGAGPSSYLDILCQNSASSNSPHKYSAWSRKQKRTYQRLKSFNSRCLGLGYSLKLVHLTSSPDSDPRKLRRHHNELIRRAERAFCCRIITQVCETREGLGVLHTVWACKSRRGLKSVYIPYEWLRQQWLSIHGAFEVRIRAVGQGLRDSQRVASYYASQYFAGQSSLERYSYSWKKLGLAIGTAWEFFKRELRQFSPESTWIGENPSCVTVDRQTLFRAWEFLLMSGEVYVGDKMFYISPDGKVGCF